MAFTISIMQLPLILLPVALKKYLKSLQTVLCLNSGKRLANANTPYAVLHKLSV